MIQIIRVPAVGAAIVAAVAACAPQADRGPASGPEAGAVTEVLAGTAPAPVVASSYQETVEAGEGRLAFFHVPSSGFAYQDESGRLTGVTVELLRDFAAWVAESQGIDLRVEWLAEPRWAAFYGYVRDSEGGAFGIGNVTITEARRAEVDFSPPYLNNVAVLVTHSDVPELGVLDDIAHAFQGLTALPYPGTLHEARLEAIRDRWLPDMPVRPVGSNDELVALLSSEAGYFGYMDVYNYWRAREAGQPLRRHPVGDDDSEAFGVILPDGSDWTPVIESFFVADGGYARSDRFQGLLREHLGHELATLLTGVP